MLKVTGLSSPVFRFDYAQECGRLELIVALKLRDWAEVCSQSQDTRSAVIGEAQNSPPITADLVSCDWLHPSDLPLSFKGTINSRRPPPCGLFIACRRLIFSK